MVTAAGLLDRLYRTAFGDRARLDHGWIKVAEAIGGTNWSMTTSATLPEPMAARLGAGRDCLAIVSASSRTETGPSRLPGGCHSKAGGELLNEVDGQGRRSDTLAEGAHGKLTYCDAARAAGLSEHRQLQSVCVANAPAQTFREPSVTRSGRDRAGRNEHRWDCLRQHRLRDAEADDFRRWSPTLAFMVSRRLRPVKQLPKRAADRHQVDTFALVHCGSWVAAKGVENASTDASTVAPKCGK